MAEKNSIPFWKRKELQGLALTALSFTPELLQALGATGILPEHTLAFKIAAPLGIVLAMFGLRKGYKADNIGPVSNAIDALPEGLRKSVFGEKDVTN